MNRNKSLAPSLSYEVNNRARREVPTRTGQEHATCETKTTKVNLIQLNDVAAIFFEQRGAE